MNFKSLITIQCREIVANFKLWFVLVNKVINFNRRQEKIMDINLKMKNFDNNELKLSLKSN